MTAQAWALDAVATVLVEVQDGVDPFHTEDGAWRMEGIRDDLDTDNKLLDHLIFNAVANGVRDAAQLDGWADLERGQITMRIEWVGVDR